jgi:hypothetical protein
MVRSSKRPFAACRAAGSNQGDADTPRCDRNHTPKPVHPPVRRSNNRSGVSKFALLQLKPWKFLPFPDFVESMNSSAERLPLLRQLR